MKKYIGVTLALNSILGECKFTGVEKSEIKSLLENKFKLTKIADDFEKKFSVIDNFKSNRYKELENKTEREKEEDEEFKSMQKKLESQINALRMEEAQKEIEIDLDPFNEDSLIKLISDNDLNIAQAELLYQHLKK